MLLDLRWHWRAWRAQARWQHTRAAIQAWLAKAPAGFDELLLVGASAGWMMPADFLERFSRIDAIDFEWAAEPLFRLRHARVLRRHAIALTFHRTEALGNLDRLLAQHPRALVLFDNVLGQYTLTCRDAAVAEARLSALQQRLRARAWGSLHDALSGLGQHRPPGGEPAPLTLPPGAAWPDALLLQQVGAHGEWRDHLTRGVLTASAASVMIPWQLKPGYWHWLQAGWAGAEAAP